jgi:hypothetical protein
MNCRSTSLSDMKVFKYDGKLSSSIIEFKYDRKCVFEQKCFLSSSMIEVKF